MRKTEWQDFTCPMRCATMDENYSLLKYLTMASVRDLHCSLYTDKSCYLHLMVFIDKKKVQDWFLIFYLVGTQQYQQHSIFQRDMFLIDSFS